MLLTRRQIIEAGAATAALGVMSSPLLAQVTQPLLFVNTLVGSQGAFETAAIEDYLREVIVSRLNDFLGESVDSLLALPQRYDEMAEAVRTRLSTDFAKYGIALRDFYINRITPPEGHPGRYRAPDTLLAFLEGL